MSAPAGAPSTRVRVVVMPREGVLDPQGKAIAHALGALGFAGVGAVRMGKVIELDLPGADAEAARAGAEAMARRLLANAVVEDFRIELA